MDRREFMKLSALFGAGMVLSSFTFSDDMGYFKMKLPAYFIYWGDKKLEEKFIICQTSFSNSFEDFIERNWSKDKSIFIYDVHTEKMNGGVYVRGTVLDIPHKLVKDTMYFDRKFVSLNK
jgi:hypothetical protein